MSPMRYFKCPKCRFAFYILSGARKEGKRQKRDRKETGAAFCTPAGKIMQPTCFRTCFRVSILLPKLRK